MGAGISVAECLASAASVPHMMHDLSWDGTFDRGRMEFMEHNMAAVEPITSLTLRRPDDWHLHLRDGAILSAVVADTAQHFGRAIVMPNLVPPVVTGADASAYRDRILAHCADYPKFQPLMTLYLTENTDASDVIAAAEAGIVHAVKLYPAGATTNSASGVRNFDKVRPVWGPLGGEIFSPCFPRLKEPSVDIFDPEAVLLTRGLKTLAGAVPSLKSFRHVPPRWCRFCA
ncbi:MAG: hypothetical protein CM15mP46_3520 [Alphaproteobacteria bacterium]|nr:MAG: hypothetical protein CM15mP46_3520 [Alphaproteobacteria bacterium]